MRPQQNPQDQSLSPVPQPHTFSPSHAGFMKPVSSADSTRAGPAEGTPPSMEHPLILLRAAPDHFSCSPRLRSQSFLRPGAKIPQQVPPLPSQTVATPHLPRRQVAEGEQSKWVQVTSPHLKLPVKQEVKREINCKSASPASRHREIKVTGQGPWGRDHLPPGSNYSNRREGS